MTACGAVLSLRNTISNILCRSRFSLVARSKQILDVVYNELDPLQQILERLDDTSRSRSRKKVNALGGRIRDALWKFEDSMESLLTQHFPSQSQTIPEIVSIDLQSLQNDANSLIETLKDMKKDYIYEVENMPRDEPISSIIGFHGTNSKMIGLSDQFKQLKTDLTRSWNHVYGLYGTAGVGKTTLAMKIYHDPKIQKIFQRRAWVTVGRVPQPIDQISRGILAQLCGTTQGDEELDYCIVERLKGKSCLIVLDDVWETHMWDLMKEVLPYNKFVGICFLLTGRHRKWMEAPVSVSRVSWNEVRFLKEEESMELLCEKVFGDESCPPQLHKAATKIAKLCEGLPLLILTVAAILSKSEQNRDPEYWNEVAEKRNSVFTDAYNRISKVLLPSYDYLPQRLKMPFLFMGVFPQDYETPASKIMIMLTAEGLWCDRQCLRELAINYSLKMPFLFMGVFPQDYETPASKIMIMLTAEGLWCDRQCLRELAINYSLVLRRFKSSDKTSHELSIREYKTCWLHSSWRHVCRGEASNNKFYHVLNKLIDAKEESLKGQRGLCLENNILFGIKEFRNSVRLSCASSTRSLLFYGPYHQYPIPIDVGFILLREIDALTQRFYIFPKEILSLVQLKYLALTCNGELPATISKLFNLRVLIIRPHLNIRRCGAPSYVPIQIWDMQELEHIEILGKSLIAPPHVASLKKLSTLVGVNTSICTLSELSGRIPNIRKLGIQIEVTPYDDHNDLLSCFGCISTLRDLETLKFSVVNPVVKHGHVSSVTPESLRFPRNLIKLHLSGMGLPWEYMDVIGSLPSLKVLKLRSYAFHGSRWETKGHSFSSLEFLLLEESDLVQWKTGLGSFPKLSYLSMKHCYRLKEIGIPACLDQYGCTVEIELEDCSPRALTWARLLQPTIRATLRVITSSSFYEKPTTSECERTGDLHFGRKDPRKRIQTKRVICKKLPIEERMVKLYITHVNSAQKT